MHEQTWMPSFACPACHAPVALDGSAFRCATCAERYERRGGIHRFLSHTQAQTVAGFVRQYRSVRRADGHAITSLAEFRELPAVPPHSRGAGEWRIRQQSFATFLEQVCGRSAAALRVLDVGAGCGWLSYRLLQLGASTVSVDVDDDEEVGLGVLARVDAGGWLVQADFDSLPFVPGQFDVVVLNASLHYAADPVCTLYAADRMLATGGALVVMDSPMFVRDEDGQLMVREQLESIARLCGVMQPLRAGAGFLTFTQLRDAAHRLHRRARFTASDGPVGWRLRRFWSRRRRGRAPASFGVWVAR